MLAKCWVFGHFELSTAPLLGTHLDPTIARPCPNVKKAIIASKLLGLPSFYKIKPADIQHGRLQAILELSKLNMLNKNLKLLFLLVLVLLLPVVLHVLVLVLVQS